MTPQKGRHCKTLLSFTFVLICFLLFDYCKVPCRREKKSIIFFCSWFSVFVCQFFTEKPPNPTRSHPFRVKRLQTTLVFFLQCVFFFPTIDTISTDTHVHTHTHDFFELVLRSSALGTSHDPCGLLYLRHFLCIYACMQCVINTFN